mmetsp:Transcript_32737/g.104444  ORF Transcript_32737/g.104444 Transcript_32737/m.104444 type:complete len:216 (-) Transcript_32737:431-1078(-)
MRVARHPSARHGADQPFRRRARSQSRRARGGATLEERRAHQPLYAGVRIARRFRLASGASRAHGEPRGPRFPGLGRGVGVPIQLAWPRRQALCKARRRTPSRFELPSPTCWGSPHWVGQKRPYNRSRCKGTRHTGRCPTWAAPSAPTPPSPSRWMRPRRRVSRVTTVANSATLGRGGEDLDLDGGGGGRRWRLSAASPRGPRPGQRSRPRSRWPR